MEYINPSIEKASADGDELVIEDLVEDISIDGMCGVY
ncbi:mycofactocin precursor MftA [Pseudarthrobacter sulfonivorans]|nr:mycofactocin precursor MftA [Pseudarthrobacter sulfonivorans]